VEGENLTARPAGRKREAFYQILHPGRIVVMRSCSQSRFYVFVNRVSIVMC